MDTQTKIKIIPKKSLLDKSEQELVWKVILFNCYCHTYEEAVEQVMMTLKCGYCAGCRYADSAEKNGSVEIFEGSFSDCTRIANILGSTGLDVKMAQ